MLVTWSDEKHHGSLKSVIFLERAINSCPSDNCLLQLLSLFWGTLVLLTMVTVRTQMRAIRFAVRIAAY